MTYIESFTYVGMLDATPKFPFAENWVRIMNSEPNEDDLAALGLAPSLESVQQSVDAAWACLSRYRLEELESGNVQGVSWQDVKSEVRG